LQEREIVLLIKEIEQLQDGIFSVSSSEKVPAELAELLLQNTKLKHRLTVLKRVSGMYNLKIFSTKLLSSQSVIGESIGVKCLSKL
jgi:precorrin-6B methylase 1